MPLLHIDISLYETLLIWHFWLLEAFIDYEPLADLRHYYWWLLAIISWLLRHYYRLATMLSHWCRHYCWFIVLLAAIRFSLIHYCHYWFAICLIHYFHITPFCFQPSRFINIVLLILPHFDYYSYYSPMIDRCHITPDICHYWLISHWLYCHYIDIIDAIADI